MNYAKASLFIDVDSQIIIDWDLVMSYEHDVKIAERIFKRNRLKSIQGLGDKGFDSEPLHEIARAHGITFYAPVRNMNQRILKQRPSGKYRRECVEMPEFKGMRSISETVNSVLKRTQIQSLRSKKHYMREREFGWQIVWYNIKRKIKISRENNQIFIFYEIEFYSIRTEPTKPKRKTFKNLKQKKSTWINSNETVTS
jgi:hypothetical protein